MFTASQTLWVLVTEQAAPPVGLIRADGEYDLTRYTREEYAAQLSVIIDGATSESPASRPSLDGFARQLADWLEGREIRDALVRADEQMRRLRAQVLRHLVARVRREPEFNYLRWEIRDPENPSGIGGLTDGEVGLALDELHEQLLVRGERKPLGRGHYWKNLYPTSYGIFEVEDERVVMAQAAPLLRAVLDSPRQMIHIHNTTERLEIVGVTMTPAEAYFQLRLLEELGLVSLREQPGRLSRSS